MRNLWFSICIGAAVLLSACGQASPAAITPTPQAAASTATDEPVATQNPNMVEMECQVVSLEPTQSPDLASNFPPVTKDDWTIGNLDSAAMTIIEYSDFQCPYCAQVAPILEELANKHPDDVLVAFRYFPLPSHQFAILGAQATEAAGAQGKFWEMHDALFAQQETWAVMTDAQFQGWLEEQAQAIGLDIEQFLKDLTSQEIVDKVAAAQQHGIDAQIPGTPFLLINGQIYQGPRDLASLEAILEMFGLKDRQYTYCPPMQIDTTKQYIATLKTEKGDITIKLFPDKAPMTVNSFVFLARDGWFDNVTFHRVLPGSLAQTGDPSGTGYGGPGYYYADEISDLKFDKPGVVGMANAGSGSNGSQFFITLSEMSTLDGQYTVFGEVIEGMDVLNNLTERDPTASADLPPGDKILSVEIQEK